MRSKHHDVLSNAIGAMLGLAAYVGVIAVTPVQAQATETDVIVGTWKNSVWTDVYSIYPDGTALDVHSYKGDPHYDSPGTWAKQTGTMYGYPYEYIWYWSFGPEQGGTTFTDYIHVVNNDNLTYVNNYGNTGSNYRLPRAPTTTTITTSDPEPGIDEDFTLTVTLTAAGTGLSKEMQLSIEGMGARTINTVNGVWTATDSLAEEGTYVFYAYFAGDGEYAPSSDAATVTVSDSPVAEAGADQTIYLKNTSARAKLDGSASYDPNGDPLTYHWDFYSQNWGSSAAILKPDSVAPTVTLDKFGKYTVALDVSDGKTTSEDDLVNILAYPTEASAQAWLRELQHGASSLRGYVSSSTWEQLRALVVVATWQARLNDYDAARDTLGVFYAQYKAVPGVPITVQESIDRLESEAWDQLNWLNAPYPL